MSDEERIAERIERFLREWAEKQDYNNMRMTLELNGRDITAYMERGHRWQGDR